MNEYSDYTIKGNADEARKPSLTEILEQTEKQLYGIRDIVEAMQIKISGPMPSTEGGPGNTSNTKPGIYEVASMNLAKINILSIELSRLNERL